MVGIAVEIAGGTVVGIHDAGMDDGVVVGAAGDRATKYIDPF